MFIENKNYMKIKSFDEVGVEAFFTTKNIGETFDVLESKELINNFLKLNFKNKALTLVCARQTHTDNIIDIEKSEDTFFYENVDGFITKRKDIALMTQHADCLPIFLYDIKEEVIGMLHSGWRGSFQEIGIKAINLMSQKYNSSKENIIIGLGVGISAKNYEVSKDFYEDFNKKFDKNIVDPSFIFSKDKIYFNNYEFNKLNFINNGIPAKNIEVSDRCTYRDNFYSFRRDKDKKRNSAVIFFK